MIRTQDFIRERNEAILSLDKDRILAFMKKHKVNAPNTEEAFWASVHKAITGMKDATMGQKLRSKAWLDARGMANWME